MTEANSMQALLSHPFFSGEKTLSELATDFEAVKAKADRLLAQNSLDEPQIQQLATSMTDHIHQIFTDEVLIHSYNGYVTFPTRREYLTFLQATTKLISVLESMFSWPIQTIPLKKTVVYYLVVGMNAATRNFKYQLDPATRKEWDDTIFRYEAEILAEDPSYVVPTTELLTGQQKLLREYWTQRNTLYWGKHRELDRARSLADAYKRAINLLGVSLLVLPLLLILLLLFTQQMLLELSLIFFGIFGLVGIAVYLLSFLQRSAKNKIKDFEFQGIGQLDQDIPSDPQSDPSPTKKVES